MALNVSIVDLETPLPNLTSQLLMPRHDVLGIGTAAALVGHNVEVYVEQLNGIPFERLVDQQVLGAAVTSANLTRVAELFARVRKANPGITLVAGGPHATLSPAEVLCFADVVVRDEGEATFVELLRAIEEGAQLDEICGISFRRWGQKVHNPRRKYASIPGAVENLNLLRGFRRKSRLSQLIQGGLYRGLVTASRGCPFPCTFCYENMIGGTGHRAHPIGQLIEDIRVKKDFFGTKDFWVADPNFTTNVRHTKDVLRALIEAELGCRFTVLSRVDIAKRPELLDLMRRAGVVTISLGMEALQDDRLATIEKRQTVNDIIRAVEMIHSFGIIVFGLFMIGFDEDTETSADSIVSFCEEHNVDGLSIYCLTEYPNLPGRTLPRYRICETNLDYFSGHFVVTFPKRVRPSILERSVFEAQTRFYSLPKIGSVLWKRGRVPELEFLLPLYLQMRKMCRVSLLHQRQLEEIEKPYYDAHGLLREDYLRQHPVVTTPLPDNVLAGWSDADEVPPTGPEPSLRTKHAVADVNLAQQAPGQRVM